MNATSDHRRLCVVVLNYRTPDLVVDCLASLEVEVADDPGAVVVVVDNASGDDSASRIAETIESRGWTGWARLVRSEVNGGFAAGNNLGIRSVQADRYLLLNSDTVVRRGAIEALEATIEAADDIGAVGPRLEWPDGTPQVSCFRWHRPCSELVDAAATAPIDRLFPSGVVADGVHDECCEPEWLSYACVLVRREAIESAGLLDEGYFMYFEDVDHCRRLRAAGWRLVHEPRARVVHLRGGSSPVKEATRSRGRRPRYFYASRSRYYAQFHGPTGPLRANLYWLAGRIVAKGREILQRRSPRACRGEWKDIWTDALPSGGRAARDLATGSVPG